MTEQPNLELRKQVAEKLGWTDLRIYTRFGVGSLWGVSPGNHEDWYTMGEVPAYELSTDACFRDIIPKAREMGCGNCEVLIVETTDGSFAACRLGNLGGWGTNYIRRKEPAEAICLAFLEVPEPE